MLQERECMLHSWRKDIGSRKTPLKQKVRCSSNDVMQNLPYTSWPCSNLRFASMRPGLSNRSPEEMGRSEPIIEAQTGL